VTGHLDRGFFDRPVLELAPDLLNKVLVGPGGRSGRIVEVEAYGGPDDPGSHAHRGPTPRSEIMFGPPGHLYVYFTYGMHWCANVVADTEDVAGAVLIRALTPLRGIDEMMVARGPAARRDRDLCSGPAKLTQALGIDGTHLGTDLADPRAVVTVLEDGMEPADDPVQTTRIGLRSGAELPWRWYVRGVVDVSRR
jgi:DNA-3-methyladenine glycosylase